MSRSCEVTVKLGQDYPVYREVNGQRIWLDAPDPNRRYALSVNVQTGESFYREFSDAEEAAANLAKAQWDSEKPQREAEELRLREEAERFEEALRYKNKLVAFIDLLGWSRAVMETVHKGESSVKALGKALAQLQGFVRFNLSLRSMAPDGVWHGDPVITHFSDSVVFSANDDELGKIALLQVLQALSSNLIPHGYLLRGGVVRGLIFHSGEMVFGPALNEAYRLESKVASSPRVILSDDLSSEWGDVTTASNGRPWRRGKDGRLFFNYLPPFTEMSFFRDNTELWQNRLMPIRKMIIESVKANSKDFSIVAKYLWLAEYFDEVCQDNPQCGVAVVTPELMSNLSLSLRLRSLLHRFF